MPQVDLWLIAQGLPAALFEHAEWRRSRSADANPLFAAALPNRFVALVPASRARELAERCRQSVRDWLHQTGETALARLLAEAGIDDDPSLYCHEQLRRQLEGFPEVHWAAVPFSLIAASADGKRIESVQGLSEAMAPFFGTEPDQPAGFLASPAWEVLSQEIRWEDGTAFWQPNPGVLYPAVYDLAERVLAAAKAVRPFAQSGEFGWRDSLTGEVEWLTTDRDQLSLPPGQRKDTLWARIAARRPAWAKPGEHLGALSAIKRLWPTLFAEQAAEAAGIKFDRFVVSTHTMALAHQLDRWLEHGGQTAEGFAETARQARERVALPLRLLLRHKENPGGLDDARALLALMEQAQEDEDDRQAERLRRVVRDTLMRGLERKDRADFRLETYYGLLLMDGDRMGALLTEGSGTRFLDSFHPTIRKQFERRAGGNERLRQYGDTPRPPSPGRHMAISGALNDFALHVVPHIVQREHLGRLIYGGGDDVMAMLPVADLLPAAARLRDAWSGEARYARPDPQNREASRLRLARGYALLDGRLLRMIGPCMTASAGLVVAHHQAPLSRVLRELRAAEKTAKEHGRNAFQIRVLKRSGGSLALSLRWDDLQLLQRLVDFLREPDVSRRAVYHCQQWLRDLPEPSGDDAMLARLLGYQFRRQTARQTTADHHGVEQLAEDIAHLAGGQRSPLDWTLHFLGVAEFLAREIRSVPARTESEATTSNGAAA